MALMGQRYFPNNRVIECFAKPYRVFRDAKLCVTTDLFTSRLLPQTQFTEHIHFIAGYVVHTGKLKELVIQPEV